MNTNKLKNRRTGVLTLRLALVSVIFWGIFMQSCSNEDNFDNRIPNTDEMEISDFRNWLNSQQIKDRFVKKNELKWDNAEIKLMQDGKSRKVSFEIYRGTNSFGNDSIRELQIAYIGDRFMGSVKVFSFSSEKEYANAEYYGLNGRIFQDGIYYAPKQQLIVLNRYTVKGVHIRLKSGSEYNEHCEGTQKYTDSDTPIQRDIFGNPINSAANNAAYNCHSYIWGSLSSGDPCYITNLPNWNNCPDIVGSGWSEVNTPQVGDRWVSYGYDPEFGYNATIHSARILEVTNGQVTKVEAKCGEKGIYIYNPDCDAPLFAPYKTQTIKYYREL